MDFIENAMPERDRPILQQVIEILDDAKAQDLRVLDVHALTTLMDYMVIVTGRSSRHVKAMAQKLIEAAKESELGYQGAQGLAQAEWVIIDLGAVVVHAMQPSTRDFYQLEKLWSGTGAQQPESALV
jgi:ribosome-associated protein